MVNATGPYEEMLARLGEIKGDTLTTEQVMHVCGVKSNISVYRWVRWGWLDAQSIPGRGRTSFYARSGERGVEALIRARFGPVLSGVKGSRGHGGDGGSSGRRSGGKARKR